MMDKYPNRVRVVAAREIAGMSRGHVAFVPRTSGGTWEYFARDGQIWRMDTSAPIMPDGYRSGRWFGPDRADTRANLSTPRA